MVIRGQPFYRLPFLRLNMDNYKKWCINKGIKDKLKNTEMDERSKRL